MVDQCGIVFLALGAPEPGGATVVFLEIERVQEQVIGDGWDVGHRELNIQIGIVGRIHQRFINQALIIQVSGIDGHLDIVHHHELVCAGVGVAIRSPAADKGLLNVEIPCPVNGDTVDLKLEGFLISGSNVHFQIRFVIVPAAIGIQPIGAVSPHNLNPEMQGNGMGSGRM